MIIPCPLTDLTTLGELFPGVQLRMVREAIAAGNTAGRLWRITAERASDAALLWDQGNNVFYLGGSTLDAETAGRLRELIAREVQPAAVGAGARYFRARGLAPALDDLLPQLFSGITLHPTTKRFYAYQAERPPVVAAPAAPDLAIVIIDREFMSAARENLSALCGEIAWMWPGDSELALAHFLEVGLGSAAVANDRIVCWCTAEYVSARRCGIGIETVEDYQRQGIATATTAHFIAAALQRGLTPCWECDSANLPSVRVAEKVGFEPVEEARFWTGLFPSG